MFKSFYKEHALFLRSEDKIIRREQNNVLIKLGQNVSEEISPLEALNSGQKIKGGVCCAFKIKGSFIKVATTTDNNGVQTQTCSHQRNVNEMPKSNVRKEHRKEIFKTPLAQTLKKINS
jgi:hypothetical protein